MVSELDMSEVALRKRLVVARKAAGMPLSGAQGTNCYGQGPGAHTRERLLKPPTWVPAQWLRRDFGTTGPLHHSAGRFFAILGRGPIQKRSHRLQ